MRVGVSLLAASLIALATAASQTAPAQSPPADTIPAARDIPYPGTMTLEVDATDTVRGIYRVRQRIPVAGPGPMVLLFPKWLPGKHAPRGEVEKLAGLKIVAGGRTLDWERDDVDVHAFHITVPAGATEIQASFEFLSATSPDQGRIVMTPDMLNLQWEQVSLYPAGWATRRIPVKASVRYPAGWQAASGLPSTLSGGVHAYQTTDYETLIDSPVFAGRHFRQERLSPPVRLNMVADDPRALAATPAQIEAHRRLVTQALKLFGTEPYDNYEFLVALSDKLGSIGLEHHRSSENRVRPGYFIDWAAAPTSRNLLPHEFVHSWNGKYRRGADLLTPDYRTPMRGNLLWVYEGQTQFWGYVLQARSGLVGKQDTLDMLATIAATLDNRPARNWRPLEDTTNDPIITPRRPKGWLSQQRSEDYYNEGLLIWVEVDAMLRAQTRGARGMDDFARAFFAGTDGDWRVSPYRFEDVVATLNAIAPHDWAGHLNDRLRGKAPRAPLKGFTDSGYELVYTEEPTAVVKEQQRLGGYADFAYSLGLAIGRAGRVTGVMWDSPAFQNGLTIGTDIVAVNDLAYSPEGLERALIAAKSSRQPIRLLIRNGDRFREAAIDYRGGPRHPRFVKRGKEPGALDKLLEPR